MDWLRSGYRVQLRTWQTGIAPVEVHWFRVPNDWPLYPTVHVFGSRNWEEDKWNAGIGEQYPVYVPPGEPARPYYRGDIPPWYDADHVCGSPAVFARGGIVGVDPPINLDGDGYSTCCGPKLAPARPFVHAFAEGKEVDGKVSIPLPADTAPGDRMLLLVGRVFGDSTWLPPADWTTLAEGNWFVGFNCKYWLGWRKVVAGETDPVVFEVGTSPETTGMLVVVRLAGDIADHSASIGNGVSIALASVPTPVPSLVVVFAMTTSDIGLSFYFPDGTGLNRGLVSPYQNLGSLAPPGDPSGAIGVGWVSGALTNYAGFAVACPPA